MHHEPYSCPHICKLVSRRWKVWPSDQASCWSLASTGDDTSSNDDRERFSFKRKVRKWRTSYSRHVLVSYWHILYKWKFKERRSMHIPTHFFVTLFLVSARALPSTCPGTCVYFFKQPRYVRMPTTVLLINFGWANQSRPSTNHYPWPKPDPANNFLFLIWTGTTGQKQIS